MNEKNLEAISPVDGRYFEKTEKLKNYFSEKANDAQIKFATEQPSVFPNSTT